MSQSRRSSSLNTRPRRQYKSPYSQENMMLGYLSREQKIIFLEEQIKSEEIMKTKLEQLVDDPCFEELQFERLFLETVEAVRNQSMKNNNNSKFIKFPSLHNKFDSLIKDTDFELDQEQQKQQETIPSFLQNSLYLSGNSDTTSFEKKQIIEQFLNNRAVKKFIHDMINEKHQEQLQKQQQSLPSIESQQQ